MSSVWIQPTALPIVRGFLVAIVVGLGEAQVAEVDPHPAKPESGVPKVEQQSDLAAEAVFRRSCDFLRGAKTLGVDLETTSATKIERMSHYSHLAIEQPNRLSYLTRPGRRDRLIKNAFTEISDAFGGILDIGVNIKSNGDKVWTWYRGLSDDFPFRPYAEWDSPPRIGALIGMNVECLQHVAAVMLCDEAVRSNLGMFIASGLLPPEELDGVACDRIVLTGREISDDRIETVLWVRAGDQPVPLLMEERLERNIKPYSTWLTTTRYRQWRINEEIPTHTFEFRPPLKAKRFEDLTLAFVDGEEPSLLGKQAPKIALEEMDKGPIDLERHVGSEIVVLSFWVSCDGPSWENLPIVAKVLAPHRGKGVVHYAVCFKEDARAVRRFLKDRNIGPSVVLDDEGKAFESFQVGLGMSCTVVIGKDGRVQANHRGYSRGLSDTLNKDINELLAGTDLTKRKTAK